VSHRPYETMVVLDPNLGDDAVEKEITKIKDYVTSEGGEISAVDLWGRRKLAYEIDGQKEGFYAVIKFRAEPRVVAPLTKAYRLNEQILRHIVLSDTFKAPLGSGMRRPDDDDDGESDDSSDSFGEERRWHRK
jgi:small subunit ribosomal protein S6